MIGPEAAVDLSAYAGVTFWAQGDAGGARTLQVMFLDSHTDPRSGFCNYLDSNSPQFCYNGFTAAIPQSRLTDLVVPAGKRVCAAATATHTMTVTWHARPTVDAPQGSFDLALRSALDEARQQCSAPLTGPIAEGIPHEEFIVLSPGLAGRRRHHLGDEWPGCRQAARGV